MFSLGTVEAVSLRDIYTKASGKRVVAPKLKVKDPQWEKLKKTNSSSLIHISRYIHTMTSDVICVFESSEFHCPNTTIVKTKKLL